MKTRSHQIQSPVFVIWDAICCILCISNVQAQTNQARLAVEFGGYTGSECQKGRPEIQLAGAQCEFILTVKVSQGNPEYRGLPVLPPSLELTASLTSDGAVPSGSSSLLVDRLQPQFYVTYLQMVMDSIAKHGVELDYGSRRPSYHFLIALPEDWAGKTLCITATLDDPQYGHLEGMSCTDIQAPCSQADRAQMSASYVKYAFDSGDFLRSVEIMDSLLQTGWQNMGGFVDGMNAARMLKDHVRELHYLDLYYATYKTTPYGPVKNSAEAQEQYQRLRSEIIQMRDEQQNPQQSR